MSGIVDHLIVSADRFLRKLAVAPQSNRPSPASKVDSDELSKADRKHAAGLMRINHTGEVCAQALYEGQAFVARAGEVREVLLQSAAEEEDHLVWCSDRLKALGAKESKLNSVFYVSSYLMGVATGAMGDKISLGFVAATEEQVCKHLKAHMDELPRGDAQSLQVVTQMYDDEQAHGTRALDAGGVNFPSPIKAGMTLLSKFMTSTTYRI